MAQNAARDNGALAHSTTLPQPVQLANNHINLRKSVSAGDSSREEKSHGSRVISSNSKHTQVHDETSSHKCLTPLEQFPELINLVATWSSLPPAIRAGILAMIQSYVTQQESEP